MLDTPFKMKMTQEDKYYQRRERCKTKTTTGERPMKGEEGCVKGKAYYSRKKTT